MDANQIIKDFDMKKISPRKSQVDYKNSSGSTVIFNSQCLGQNSKGSIALIQNAESKLQTDNENA